LFGAELKANEWTVLGFVNAFFLESIGIDDGKRWTIKFTSGHMNKIYAEWDNVRRF
jgi:hypothetical protein